MSTKDELCQLHTFLDLTVSMLEQSQREVLSASSEKLNMRGALEYIRGVILLSDDADFTSGKERDLDFTDKPDTVMLQLQSDEQFSKILSSVIDRKNASLSHIPEAMNSLWNTVCMHYNGRDDDIIIHAEHYSEDECIVLFALFDHFSIPFSYWKYGKPVDFFDEAGVKSIV